MTAPDPKNIGLIERASHLDLDDGPRVDEVVGERSPFVAHNLMATAGVAA